MSSEQAGGRHAGNAAAADVAGAARSGTPDVSAGTCEVGDAQAGGRHAASAAVASVAGAAGSGGPDVSAGTCEVSEGGCAPAAQATDLDAGQAVIKQAGGLHLGTAAARRVACDAGLVALWHGADGQVLDVGRRRAHGPDRSASRPARPR